MSPNLTALYASIQRCDAVYIPDADAAITKFQSMGSTEIVRLCTDTNQAILHRPPDGIMTLTDSGTRVSEGTFIERVCDIYQDMDYTPYDLGGSCNVAIRPFKDALELYTWVTKQADGKLIRIEGHSLGGQKTTYAMEYLPADQIISMTAWESPHQGNDIWWLSLQNKGWLNKLTQVYHGRDPWALWPWESTTLTKGPGSVVWAHSGICEVVPAAALPKAEFINLFDLPDAGDHDTSNIMSTFEQLVAQPTLV